jgi:hypothetical protein
VAIDETPVTGQHTTLGNFAQTYLCTNTIHKAARPRYPQAPSPHVTSAGFTQEQYLITNRSSVRAQARAMAYCLHSPPQLRVQIWQACSASNAAARCCTPPSPFLAHLGNLYQAEPTLTDAAVIHILPYFNRLCAAASLVRSVVNATGS